MVISYVNAVTRLEARLGEGPLALTGRAIGSKHFLKVITLHPVHLLFSCSKGMWVTLTREFG